MIFLILTAILLYAEWHSEERLTRLHLLCWAGINLFCAWALVAKDIGLS